MSQRTAWESGPTVRAACAIAWIAMAGGPWATAEHEGVALCRGGQSRVYLDVTDNEARSLGIVEPVADFIRCWADMTGRPLPRTGGTAALFDPTLAQPTHFECRITNITDASRYGAPNAMVELALGPQPYIERSPLASPGEKVVWSCVWDRAGKKLTFALTVANTSYYGPGYGPFRFATLTTASPDFGKGGELRMALEMHGAEPSGVRGSYSVDRKPWVSTRWFDPTTAATDERKPGESDKNGPQAWKPDWRDRWKTRTAFYVTAYHPKGRQGLVALDEARVKRGERVLFQNDFSRSGTDRNPAPGWTVMPSHGKVEVTDGKALLRPEPGGWNTVGLRARADDARDLSGLKPLRVELKKYPAGVSRYDAHTVQGFEINATTNGVTLSACTSLGLQNGLYFLLRHWGCRWVMPGDIGECIPKLADLTFPAGVTHFSPYADTSDDPNSYRRWANRNLGGWRHWLSAQHYWFYAIPPEKYFDAHPNWFSMIGGQRVPRQLCTSNPEVVARMIEKAKDYLRRTPSAMSFPMDPNDNLDFCQCKRCRALDPPGITRKGVPSMTDRVLTFANAVAAGIREEFPDRYVAFYAYATHLDPPVRVKPASNVIIPICRSGNCLLHLMPNPRCPTSTFHDLLQRWHALTPNIYTYEYDPISWTGGLPCPTYLEMARSLKAQFVRFGVKGSYSDGMQYVAYASTYINRYMARQMKVDPTQDPDDVLRDMCRHFFGPVAKPLECYYRELAKVTQFTHPGRARVGGGTTFYSDIFSPEIVRAARNSLDEALSLTTKQDIYSRRVAMVDMSQRYLEAYLEGVWSAQAHRYEAAVAGFDRMDATIDEMAVHHSLDGLDAHRRAKTMRMKALARYFPKRLGFVTRWKLLGPFDNTTRDADIVRDRFEPIPSIAQPVTLQDGTTMNWREYESHGGFLNLEKAFADVPKNWVLSYAYAGTTFQAPKAVYAQLRMDSFFPFRVFVDGKQVFYRPGLDADCPDKRMVGVWLAAGTHTVVFKLCQTIVSTATFPWGLYFRIVAEGRDAARFPEKWLFRTDPNDRGVKEHWYALDAGDTGWRSIAVPSRWENTIGPYDGFGWYRVRLHLPVKLKGKKLRLKFWGVDEQAWVYWNGKYLGERTTKSTGKTPGEIWDQPFSLSLPPERVSWGQDNLLAIRVHDSAYAGGVFRAVRLLIEE